MNIQIDVHRHEVVHTVYTYTVEVLPVGWRMWGAKERSDWIDSLGLAPDDYEQLDWLGDDAKPGVHSAEVVLVRED